MSVIITMSVKGTGSAEAYRNGSLLGVVPPNQSKPFIYEVGDTFLFKATIQKADVPFVKWTNSAGQFTSDNPFTGTISTGGDITAHFSDEGAGGMSAQNVVLLLLGALVLAAILAPGGKK